MSQKYTTSGNPLVASAGEYNSTLPTLANGDSSPTQCDVNGITLVNPGVSNGTPTQIAKDVSTTSIPVLTGAAGIKYLRIENHNSSTGTAFLAFGFTPAVADNTCSQILPGKDLTFSGDYVPSCDIASITNTGTAHLHIIVGF